MTIALVSGAHVLAQSTTTLNVTTGSIDTTGADFLVAAVSYYSGGGGAATLSDSKGNTWTGLTLNSDVSSGTSGNLRIYYCAGGTVGSGHTFTGTSVIGGSYPGIAVAAFSGVDATPFDQHNYSNGVFGTTVQPGSVTPTTNDQLLVTAWGIVVTGGSNPTCTFTLLDSFDRNGNGIGVGLAYKIQTTAGAENPTWTTSGASFPMANIATFKAAAGGGGGGGFFARAYHDMIGQSRIGS